MCESCGDSAVKAQHQGRVDAAADTLRELMESIIDAENLAVIAKAIKAHDLAGESLPQIGRAFNVNQSTVRVRLKRMGVPLRDASRRSGWSRVPTWTTPSGSGATTTERARRFDVARDPIRRRLARLTPTSEHGLTDRPAESPPLPCSGVGTGTRPE
jgi:hypothetical protein